MDEHDKTELWAAALGAAYCLILIGRLIYVHRI